MTEDFNEIKPGAQAVAESVTRKRAALEAKHIILTRPRADRQQFDGAGALKRRQESLRHQVPSGSRAEWQKAKKASIGADRRARATIASIRSRRRAAGRPLDRLPSTDCERIRRRKLASLEAWLVLVSLRIDLGTSWILYSTQAMKYGRKTTVPSRLSSP